MARTAFVLTAMPGGAMIVNRLDYQVHERQGSGAGVGACLLELGSHEQGEIDLISDLAAYRRKAAGPGVVILDGGANIGTHTVAWARLMDGWGQVMAFEPQERVYYALAGNVALNNCFNASARRAMLGSKTGHALIPQLDHQKIANFGGLSLKSGIKQDPGQKVDFNPETMAMSAVVAIDDLKLPRLDIIKLDIEGMEPDALEGAKVTIERLKPILFVETMICGNIPVAKALPDYSLMQLGMNALAIHKSDEALLSRLKYVDGDKVSFEGGTA